jgi:hypothetical protein
MKTKIRITGNIKSFGLTDEQHKAAVEIIRKNEMTIGCYGIDAVYPVQVDVWSNKDYEYSPFLKAAKDNNADVYIFSHYSRWIEQEIGYVAVY